MVIKINTTTKKKPAALCMKYYGSKNCALRSSWVSSTAADIVYQGFVNECNF